ncbi:MAG: MBL fold metallo-hydrolase [SAR324 cluster bacterium]|nr:MBL fold metallo-hydrolase [SAR324 cluster bacterium]
MSSRKTLFMKSLMGMAFLMATSASCQTLPYDPTKKHHTAEGFVNNYPHEKHGFTELLKWKWESFDLEVKTKALPLAENDPEYLRKNRTDPTLTWIGHATFLLQFAGLNILTDPQLSERASPVSFAGPKRYTPVGLPIERLPLIDVVIISHNHYDHLDLTSVKQINDQQKNKPPLFFVPLGLKSWFAEQGIENVVEMDWWDQQRHREWTIHSVPVQHFSARTPWDRDKTLWTGWILQHPDFVFFFAGDTGYSKDFADIQKRLGPIDLSALPIGAYEPRWFMKSVHFNPDDAVKAHQDLRSRYSVGMHWGTFKLTDEPIEEPPRLLKKALEREGISQDKFFIMKHGQTISLEFINSK